MQQNNHFTKYESKVYSQGKTTLPLAIRNKLGIYDNETLIYITKDNSVEITTRRLLMEQMKQKLLNSEVQYTTDDFIAERHQDAIDELKD